MKASTFGAILGNPRSKLKMWNFDPITSESRNWSNEESQGREAKESHKDNSLSEKAAKKIHEAGNCELRETKIQATHSKEYNGEMYTLMEKDGEVGLYERSHTIGNNTSR